MELLNSMVKPVVTYAPDNKTNAKLRSDNPNKPSEPPKDASKVDARVQTIQKDGNVNILQEKVVYEVDKKSGELILTSASPSSNEHSKVDTQKAIDFKGNTGRGTNGLLLNKAM